MGSEGSMDQQNGEAITVVPLNEEDLEQILIIERLSFLHPWSKYAFRQELRNRFSRLFGIRVPEDDKNALAGYLCMWLVKDEGHITNIAIHPRFRRQGLARRLLYFAREQALRGGAEQLILEVRRSNLAAIDFYQKEGFQAIGVRKGYYYEDGEDALIMSLRLDSNFSQVKKVG
ncbi:MAG: ribosomal protein S18-alanine N-acetyltransferase [Thermodesulfobacteriota bacterium]